MGSGHHSGAPPHTARFARAKKRGKKKILAERETRAIQNTHPKIQINHTHTPTHTKKGKEKYGPRPRAFAFNPLYNTSFPLQSSKKRRN